MTLCATGTERPALGTRTPCEPRAPGAVSICAQCDCELGLPALEGSRWATLGTGRDPGGAGEGEQAHRAG